MIKSVSSKYSVGRGSASGQYSIIDGNGKVVSYADSRAEAIEFVNDLNREEGHVSTSHISPLSLFRGYIFEKERGSKKSFAEFAAEINDSLSSSAQTVQSEVSSYKSLHSGDGGVITSSLVPANFNILGQIKQGQPGVWKLLNTPASDPRMEAYRYLLTYKDWKRAGNKTLLDLILGCLKEDGFESSFVHDGKKYTGFFSYHRNDLKALISRVKIFSWLDNNPGMAGDLKNFIKEHIDSYNITWMAYRGNRKAIAQYESIRDEFGGKVKKGVSIFTYFLPMGGLQSDVQLVKEVSDKKGSNMDSSDALGGSGQGSQAESPSRSKLQKSSYSGKGEGFQGITNTTNNAELIESATVQELIDGNDNPNFYRRGQHLAATKAQGDSEIMRVFANTIELRTKSENFDSNKTYYRQWIMLKDFKTIAKDKKIKLDEAVDYSLNFGDVNIRCNCPSNLYHGFAYMGDELEYLYGLPREKRFPHIRNPQLQNATCKHMHMALEHVLKNKEKLIKMFSVYYKRLDETPEDTMIAIPAAAAEEEKMSEEEKNLLEVLGEEVPDEKEIEPEVISEQEPETGNFKVDTKLAEGKLPPEMQVKYAGEEEKPTDEATAEDVADTVSEEEVEELGDQIDEADTGPRSDDERFMHEWSFQRFNRDNSYKDLLVAESNVSLISSSWFLGGALSSFSDTVMDLMPKGSVPVEVGSFGKGYAGYMVYPYMTTVLQLRIFFHVGSDGTGYVSVTGDISGVMEFNSVERLRSAFPVWFSKLRGNND